MTIKQQFNASTLKASYTAATKKVQIVDTTITSVCEWCTDTQPAWIDVTISGLSDYGCCQWQAAAVLENRCLGFANEVNGTWRVLHDNGCLYTKLVTIPDITANIYNSQDGSCQTVLATCTITQFQIAITLQEVGVKVFVRGIPTGTCITWKYYYYIFLGTILYTGDDECANTSNSINNSYTACSEYIDPNYFCYPCTSTGSATISIP